MREEESNINEEVEKKEEETIINKETGKQLGKSLIGGLGSVFGFKSFYDVPEYFRERFSVKGSKTLEKISGGKFGGGIEKDIDEYVGDKKDGVEGSSLKELEKKLLLTKDARKKGSEARKIIAEIIRRERGKDSMKEGTEGAQLLENILKDYEEKTEWNKEQKDVLMKSLLDEYTETKISGMQATKEALNTLLVGFDFVGLRGLMYGSFSIAERYKQKNLEAKKRGEEMDAYKEVVLDGVKEFYQGLTFQTEKGKGIAFAKSCGSLLRFVGISESILSGIESEDLNNIIESLSEKEWGSQLAGSMGEKLSFLESTAEAGDIDEVVSEATEIDEVVSGEVVTDKVVSEEVVLSGEVKEGDNLTFVVKRIFKEEDTPNSAKDAFIERYFSGQEINDENREDLLEKAINRMSVSNTEEGNLQNLIYQGNRVVIDTETGEIIVEKGDSDLEAKAVSEIELREGWAKKRAEELGLDPQKVVFAGDSLEDRLIKVEIDNKEMIIDNEGRWFTDEETGHLQGEQLAEEVFDKKNEVELPDESDASQNEELKETNASQNEGLNKERVEGVMGRDLKWSDQAYEMIREIDIEDISDEEINMLTSNRYIELLPDAENSKRFLEIVREYNLQNYDDYDRAKNFVLNFNEVTPAENDSLKTIFFEEINSEEVSRSVDAIFGEKNIQSFDQFHIERNGDGDVLLNLTRKNRFFDDTFQIKITDEGSISMSGPTSFLNSHKYNIEETEVSRDSLRKVVDNIREYTGVVVHEELIVDQDFEESIIVTIGNNPVSEESVDVVIEKIKETERGKDQFVEHLSKELRFTEEDKKTFSDLVNKVVSGEASEDNKNIFQKILKEYRLKIQGK